MYALLRAIHCSLLLVLSLCMALFALSALMLFSALDGIITDSWKSALAIRSAHSIVFAALEVVVGVVAVLADDSNPHERLQQFDDSGLVLAILLVDSVDSPFLPATSLSKNRTTSSQYCRISLRLRRGHAGAADADRRDAHHPQAHHVDLALHEHERLCISLSACF